MRCIGSILLSICLITAAWADQNITVEYQSGRAIRLQKTFKTLYLMQPEIANYTLKSPGVLFVSGKKVGKTHLQLLDQQGHILETYHIHVIYPVSSLKTVIKKIAPKARIDIETVGHYLLLQGRVKTVGKHKKIIEYAKSILPEGGQVVDLLKVNEQSHQINLRVKLIEVSRELHRAVGLNFSSGFLNPNSSHQTAAASFTANTTALTSSVSGGATHVFDFGAYSFGHFNISALLNILDQEKLATVLAEPNITTLSGQTASIKVGGEVPITSSSTGLIPTNQVNYKKYGIELKFTPELLDNGRIRVKVAPSISRPLGDVTTTLVNPVFLNRSVSTTVELLSGQSFAVAGLLENQLYQDQMQLPGVKKVPLLGNLLSQEKSSRTEREFVIVIVPYIVHPTQNGMAHLVAGVNGLRHESTQDPGFIAN